MVVNAGEMRSARRAIVCYRFAGDFLNRTSDRFANELSEASNWLIRPNACRDSGGKASQRAYQGSV